jgi:hypothetical protein
LGSFDGEGEQQDTSMNISGLLLAIFFFVAASLLGNDELKERLQPPLEAITPDGLLAHIKVLASDIAGQDLLVDGGLVRAM